MTYSSTKTDEKVEAKQKIRYETYALGYLQDHNTIISKGQPYEYHDTHYVKVDKLKVNLRKWMKRQNIPQSNSLVDNVAPIVEAVAVVAHDLPCWQNGRLETLVPFKNGLLRLDLFLAGEQCELLEHTPNYQSTWCIPTDYETDGECPKWLTFLSECLEGEEDQIALCQEWFGYILSGDTSRQKYMAHVGAKGSGKSTVARILERLVGDGSTGFNLRQLAGRFGLTAIQGRSLAICGEVELQGCKERSEIIERLKSITGNDKQQIERKGDNEYPSIYLPTRFHIISNTMPLLRDPSLALARRMLVLWSPSSAKNADDDLEAKLTEELPGIVRWSLEGCRRLKRQGRFTATKRMDSELAAIERDASPLIAFLRDRCEVHRSLDGGTLSGVKWYDGQLCYTTKQAVWEAALIWETDTQIELPKQPSWFWRDLRACLPRMGADRVRQRVDNKLTEVLIGIKLN